MADPSIRHPAESRPFSTLFPSPYHSLPRDSREWPGSCWYCGGAAVEPPRLQWIQIIEARLTDRGRAQWALRPVAQNDGDHSPTVVAEPVPGGPFLAHLRCQYLNWDCEKWPETVSEWDDLTSQWEEEANETDDNEE